MSDTNSNYNCDQQYVKSIMQSEAQIAECLKDILCDFKYNIDKIEPIDKRAILIEKILCAYSCKEKAMAELIDALTKKTKANKPLCKKQKHTKHSNNTIVLLLILLFLVYTSGCFNLC